MKAGWFVFAIGPVVVALLSAPGPAAAFCVIVEPPTPLPTQVNGTQVEIQLTEGFARVVIIKEFYNPSDQPKQGQIAFPLEKGHELITDLRLKIGNVTYGSSTQNRTDALNAFLNQTRPTPTSDLLIRFRAAGASLSQFAEVNGDRYVRFSVDATDSAFASSVRPTPRALLILLDGSGSMGFLDRWALAKDAVRRIASDLGPGESYGVAVFHGATVTPFSPTLQRWTPATEGDLVRFLDSFRPRGSTGLATPLAQADSWAVDARQMGQQPIVVLISDERPTRSPLDPDLETAYSRISYDRQMPIFAMAVQPADHADETLLHNLSHYHGGDLMTIFGDVSSPVADLLAAIRVPVLQGVQGEIPNVANLTFASANPQIVWQGGEAVMIAQMRGTANDSLDVRMTWPDASGATRALGIRSAGPDIPIQPLLARQGGLPPVHG